MPRFATALAVLVLAVSPAIAQGETRLGPTPEQLGNVFCLSRLASDDAIISGVLSKTLSARIALAWERNGVIEAANPGDKPPLGDGVPWQTAPDYMRGCNVLAATDAGADIQYTDPDYPDDGWTDHLVFTRENGYLRIDDLRYAASGEPLSVSLDSIFADFE